MRRLLEPLVQFFRFIPPIAWLTPVLIWFGIGENGKYVLIVYTTTFMVMLNTLRRRRRHAGEPLRAARCLGARALADSSAYVIVPTTLPYILTGMRIGMANSLQTLVVAEMLAANEGLGFLIINSRISLSTELVYRRHLPARHHRLPRRSRAPRFRRSCAPGNTSLPEQSPTGLPVPSPTRTRSATSPPS